MADIKNGIYTRKRPRVNFTLSYESIDQIALMAKELGISRSGLIEGLIRGLYRVDKKSGKICT